MGGAIGARELEQQAEVRMREGDWIAAVQCWMVQEVVTGWLRRWG